MPNVSFPPKAAISCRFSWWAAFICVLTITVCLIGSLGYDKNWLGYDLIASLIAPCCMLEIKIGTGDA